MEALIIIDMQNYFISETLKSSFPDFRLPDQIVPSIAECLQKARALNIPIVHVITEYKTDKSNWPASKYHRETLYCMEGSREAEIIDQLTPIAGEAVIIKSRYSGFYETELEDILKSKGIDSVVLAGYALDCCVRFTAVDAYNVGFKTIILRDCVRSSQEETEESVKYLELFIQSEVRDSGEWLDGYDQGQDN